MGYVLERMTRVPVTIRAVWWRMAVKFMIATLAGMTVVGILAGVLRAEQEGPKVYRLGLLHSSSSGVELFTGAFRESMRERGYVEGKNYVLEIHARERTNDQLSKYAADLVRRKVDIILTVGLSALRAAKEATSTIPIVVHTGSDPVRRGLVASLAHPGGNITGVLSRSVGLSAKRLELLAEAVPGVERIAILTPTPRTVAREGRTYRELESAAREHGVQLQILRARDPSEIDKAFAAMIEGQAGALLLTASPYYFQHREQIVEQAAKNRLPTIYFHSQHAEIGGLITYGMQYVENYRRMAIYVDKILKGANPGNLPFEQPTKLELVINLKTAAQLGLAIPASVLFKADRVIK